MTAQPPPCEKCGRSIGTHHIRGHLAYCDADHQTRSSFLVRDVLLVRRMVGWPVSDAMRDMEIDERRRLNA